jgi:hypothetical protein
MRAANLGVSEQIVVEPDVRAHDPIRGTAGMKCAY